MATYTEFGIWNYDMYNMDETGFAIGYVQGSNVVVNKASKTRFILADRCGLVWWNASVPIEDCLRHL